MQLVVCEVRSGEFIPESTYHDYNELESFLQNIHMTFPLITNLYSIGKSVEGRQLYVMSLGKYPQTDELLQPKVKYVGSMHGNEAVGKEVLLNFIKYLAVSYETNSTVRQFLDTTQVHIMPSMNPDGFETAKSSTGEGTCSGVVGRYNARNVDLNRNFPDYFVNNNVNRADETKAVMNWLAKTHFVLSANLHGGAMVANYPFDNYHGVNPQNPISKYSRAPDDDVFIHLAKAYSFNHATMYSGPACDSSDRFTDGITNGAEWYPATGVMQDYNYLYAGCMELTIELSCCKFPASSELKKYWSDNKNALFSYLNQVHIGVFGIVIDEADNLIAGASITVGGREQFVVKTTARGEYWRLLLPGNYTLKVSCPGYGLEELSVVIPIEPGRIMQNITLIKDDIHTSDCARIITGNLVSSLFGIWCLVSLS